MKNTLDTFKGWAGALILAALLGLGGGLPAGEARAAVLTNGCINAGISCSLQELANGSSFSVGGQTYADWFFGGGFGLWSGEELALALDAIVVTPIEGAGGQAGFNVAGAGFGEPAEEDWALSFGFTMGSVTPLLAAGLEFPSNNELGLSFAMSDLSGLDTAIGIPGFVFEELAVPVPELPGLDAFSTFFIALGEALDVTQLFVSVEAAGESTGGRVPAPGSALLVLAGLGLLGAMRRNPPATS